MTFYGARTPLEPNTLPRSTVPALTKIGVTQHRRPARPLIEVAYLAPAAVTLWSRMPAFDATFALLKKANQRFRVESPGSQIHPPTIIAFHMRNSEHRRLSVS